MSRFYRANATQSAVMRLHDVQGLKNVFFCVQLDECGWQQDECKWTNGHAVRYSLNKPKDRNEIDVY